MDKHQAMLVTGEGHLDLSGGEAGNLIRDLGQGFIAAISILRDVRTDLRQGTCPSCQAVTQALGAMPHDDLERLLGDLEEGD